MDTISCLQLSGSETDLAKTKMLFSFQGTPIADNACGQENIGYLFIKWERTKEFQTTLCDINHFLDCVLYVNMWHAICWPQWTTVRWCCLMSVAFDNTKQVCINKTMNHHWSPELLSMNILWSSKRLSLKSIHSKEIEFIYILYIIHFLTNEGKLVQWNSMTISSHYLKSCGFQSRESFIDYSFYL